MATLSIQVWSLGSSESRFQITRTAVLYHHSRLCCLLSKRRKLGLGNGQALHEASILKDFEFSFSKIHGIFFSPSRPGEVEELGLLISKDNTDTRQPPHPAHPFGFFITPRPSFLSILTTLEIGLTSSPLPFMKTLTLLTPPSASHAILSTHLPLLEFASFLIPPTNSHLEAISRSTSFLVHLSLVI